MTEKRRKAPALRLFFALWPDDQLREALRQATRKAVRASGGRPVPARNLHVTLAFLGSVAETDRASVEAAAAAVSEPAFAFALDRLKVWPRANTLVLAPGSAGEGLARLHSTLWSGLGEIGYPRETRPFRPHVTLARKVATPGEMPSRCADRVARGRFRAGAVGHRSGRCSVRSDRALAARGRDSAPGLIDNYVSGPVLRLPANPICGIIPAFPPVSLPIQVPDGRQP